MPHITEEIWHFIPGKLYKENQKSLMLSAYPQADPLLRNESSERQINKAIEAVKALRNIRQTFNLPVSAGINIKIFCENPQDSEDFELTESYIKTLARVEQISTEMNLPAHVPSKSATAMIGKSLITVALEGLIDLEKETERQKKKIETLTKEKTGLDARINSPRFLENAPKEVIVQTKERIKEIKQQTQAIDDLLKSLAG